MGQSRVQLNIAQNWGRNNNWVHKASKNSVQLACIIIYVTWLIASKDFIDTSRLNFITKQKMNEIPVVTGHCVHNSFCCCRGTQDTASLFLSQFLIFLCYYNANTIWELPFLCNILLTLNRYLYDDILGFRDHKRHNYFVMNISMVFTHAVNLFYERWNIELIKLLLSRFRSGHSMNVPLMRVIFT